MTRLLSITVRLAFYRWAQREIRRTHPDVAMILMRVTELEHEQRAEIARIRRWRNTSPTLSAVKNWL